MSSKTIDQRVVEMQFDNKHFESNVQTSLSTLDKLKQSLNMTGASKGLENVSSAAKNCDMSGLSGAVQTVHAKFSALEVMAVTALSNITNSALNAGKKIVSALTIDPIKTGLSEYELKMNAIQTILTNTTSKGTTLDQVNAALDELNTYADKTVYNFGQMTDNIGKFTAAGLGLEDSVTTITGMSNVAAGFGVDSTKMATATYQMSQALSAGYIQLMDWKSLETAGMGGEMLQNALKETAKQMGVVVDESKPFRQTLQEGWLTTDIFVKTMEKMANDKSLMAAAQNVTTFTKLWGVMQETVQSGWAQTWEAIIGNKEESTKLFTEISNGFSGLIQPSIEARNAMWSFWGENGGRTAAIDSLKNAFEGILSLVAPIKEGFQEIFPPITAKQLVAFSEGLRELTSHLKLSDETSANLKSTFKGLFAILDIVKEAFTAIFKAVSPLAGEFWSNLGGGILGVTANWGDWLVKLRDTIKTTDVFNTVMQGVVGFIKLAKTAVGDFIQIIKEKFDFPGLEIFHSFLERVHERMSQVGDAAGGMKSGVVTAVEVMGESLANSKFLQMLQSLWDGIKTIGKGIASAFGVLTEGIAEKIGNADFKGIFDVINSLIAGGIGVGLMKFLKSVREPLEGLTGILDGVRGCFEAYQTQLKAGALLKIASAIAILAASILVISLIDSEKLAASLGAITVLFADLMGSMSLFGKISGNLTGVFKTCTAMISISVAVLILASALKKIGELDFKEMVTGLVGVVGLTAAMVAAAKIMGSGSATIIKGATQMVIFAAAIKILASACEDLSKLSWEQLAKGLVGVGVLMAEISLFLNTAKFSGKSITTATGIVILAAAIKILASACKDFGLIEWDDIGKGLTSIGVLLAEIAIFTNLTGNAKHVISTGVALIAIGAAMKIFASAIKDFSTMQWGELARGLTGMAGALLAVTVAVNFMPKNMVGIGVGLIAVSTALLIMASALDKFGSMQWDEIARGLVALGGSMAILAIGLNVMNGTLAGSAAMLVAVAALAVLAPVLSILGAMSWEAIAKGLVAIAGAFAVIGVAGLVLTPLVPTILALGGAFALIGIGVLGIGAGLLAAGAGLSALAVGFTALAVAGAAGATSIVAALTVIITGVASLIPAVIEKIGEGLIAFCKVIADGAPAIGEAVKAVVLSLVDVLVECVPAIANGVLELVAGVLAALVKYTPQIVDSVFQFLIGILEGVARNLPGLIKAAIDVLMSFFSGIVDALSSIDVDVLLKGIVGIGLLSAIMIALAAVAALVPAAMLGVLGMGVVIAELALVLAAIGALAQIPGLNWLINEGAKLMEGIGNAIGSFIGGIVGGFMSGVSGQFPQIGTDLSAFMTNVQPFIAGAKMIDASAMNGVKALAETILILTAANILEGLTSWFTGGSSMAKFGQELAEFGPYFKNYYESIKGIDGSVVESSANAALALAEFAKEVPNSGGVAGWFAGENSLSAFAEELMAFGPKLKAYADSVKGLDASVVINSANAAKALAEMANNLPNQGGAVSWFTGENSLSAFAEELVEFGPKLKAYADSVNGLDGNVVANSANAAKALAEMSNNLPNQGGAVSWFTGDNTLSMFGTELAAFGPSLKAYADSVSGLDANVVTNSANAAKALSELSTNLPNSGGIVSWFTGDNDIATFGTKLVSFGQSFASYYASVSTVNCSQLSGIIVEFKKLVDLATGISSIDTSGMSSFSQNLTTLGNSGIDGFISAFTGASSRVTTAATTMLTTFINGANAKKVDLTTTFTTLIQTVITAINSKQLLFNTAGQTLMVNFVTGIRVKDPTVSSTVTQIVSGALTMIKNKYMEFNAAGQTLMINFIAGINSKDSAVSNTFSQIVSGALTAIKNKYTDFYNAGKYLVEGFAEGISANTYLAEAQARAMAAAAARAAERELDEHSPSKVGYRIGDFFGLAFVNAIGDYESKSYKAGAGMAESAKKGLSNAVSKITDAINGGIDTQPTIRPVLDLSAVESETSKLNALFSRSQAMSISSGMNRTSSEEIQNGVTPSETGTKFTFTQNNYSPKPLSRVEIYRQTKNQFSAMKGLVEA